MCRWTSIANIWPGAMRPEFDANTDSGVDGAEYAPVVLDLGANDAPKRMFACCSVSTLTTTSAIPAAIAAAASPIEPAEPPPPPVRPAVKRTSGMPRTCASRLVSMNAPP